MTRNAMLPTDTEHDGREAGAAWGHAAVETSSDARSMRSPTPFYREAGDGPGVVCLHANASTSGQWRMLMTDLAPRFRVLAADTYGAGKSPPWPTDRRVRLRDEVDLLEPVFAVAGEPFSIVAHSYGAAVALVAAVHHPERVHALALYEPTLFGLIDAATPAPNDADGIRQTVASATSALEVGDRDRAAGCFIDFWMGANTWEHTPESRRGPIVASIANISGWADALFGEPTPLSAFSALDIPVLLMTGSDSPASSLGVTQLLEVTLPHVEIVEFPGMGHMAPVTHRGQVNAAIARFLDRQ